MPRSAVRNVCTQLPLDSGIRIYRFVNKVQTCARWWVARQQRKQEIVAEDSLHIADETTIIRGCATILNILLLFGLLLTKFNSSHSLNHEPHVEHPEASNQNSKESSQSFAKKEHEHMDEGCIRALYGNRVRHRLKHRPNNEVAIKGSIEKQQEEILMVPEAYTIVNPGTVMVHLQNACFADPTMVATVRLVLGAPFAMTPCPIFLLFEKVWDLDISAWYVLP